MIHVFPGVHPCKIRMIFFLFHLLLLIPFASGANFIFKGEKFIEPDIVVAERELKRKLGVCGNEPGQLGEIGPVSSPSSSRYSDPRTLRDFGMFYNPVDDNNFDNPNSRQNLWGANKSYRDELKNHGCRHKLKEINEDWTAHAKSSRGLYERLQALKREYKMIQ